MEVLLAKTLSTVVAATIAFVGNRFWTWRHRERSGLRREYLLYFFFNAVGLGIGLACLGISHYGLGSIWPDVFQTQLADNIAARSSERHSVPCSGSGHIGGSCSSHRQHLRRRRRQHQRWPLRSPSVTEYVTSPAAAPDDPVRRPLS